MEQNLEWHKRRDREDSFSASDVSETEPAEIHSTTPGGHQRQHFHASHLSTPSTTSPLVTPGNEYAIPNSIRFLGALSSGRSLAALLQPSTFEAEQDDGIGDTTHYEASKSQLANPSERIHILVSGQRLLAKTTGKGLEFAPRDFGGQNGEFLPESSKRKRTEPDEPPANKITGWALIQHRFPHLESHVHGGRNTDYQDTSIDLNDLQEWDDTFPTYQDIYNFSKSTSFLWERFHAADVGNPVGHNTFRHRFFDPANPMIFAESDLAAVSNGFFDHLNFLIRLATETSNGQNFIMIHGSKAARLRRKGGRNHSQKEPDRTSFWFDGRYPRNSTTDRAHPLPATHIPCLIVGDYKLYGKFRHRMLVERSEGKNDELQKVMNQIHDYMDMHHCRFGYILTETELIMFRRREGGWGHIDFSKAVRRNATSVNELNALMVLWYFHVKYAFMNAAPGYYLESHYNKCPEDLGGGVYTAQERRELKLPETSAGTPTTKTAKRTVNRKAVFRINGKVTLA